MLGDRNRSGQQFDIWEATYSPVDEDGYPKDLWDPATGAIDPTVAAYWREHYDLSYILPRLEIPWPEARREAPYLYGGYG